MLHVIEIEAQAATSQVATLNKARLSDKVGHLDRRTFSAVEDGSRRVLRL